MFWSQWCNIFLVHHLLFSLVFCIFVLSPCHIDQSSIKNVILLLIVCHTWWAIQEHISNDENECFNMRAKCIIIMIIRVTVILMMVYWPVCTQISITKSNLNCSIQMMVRRCFPVTHLSIHAAKLPCECLDL